MNPNANDVSKYMIIHLLLFIFKNIISKWLLKLSAPKDKNSDKETELLKQQLETLKEQISEISATSEYVKYTKMQRQIDNLNERINNKESQSHLNNINLNQQNDLNIFQKMINRILNSYIYKFFMYFLNIIEYIFLKNEYLEVDYNSNKNNIIVNHYYNEEDNKDYALIPVYKILIFESVVINSLYNLAQKIF